MKLSLTTLALWVGTLSFTYATEVRHFSLANAAAGAGLSSEDGSGSGSGSLPDSFILADSVVSSEAYQPFMDVKVHLAKAASATRHKVRGLVAAIEKRITPEYLYVLMCTDAGFRGNCTALGAKAGRCVSFFDFADTEIAAIFNDAVSSLSTNTGGMCQFYNEVGCDADGTEPGISLAYSYNLSSSADSDYVGVGPYHGDRGDNITAWRC